MVSVVSVPVDDKEVNKFDDLGHILRVQEAAMAVDIAIDVDSTIT